MDRKETDRKGQTKIKRQIQTEGRQIDRKEIQNERFQGLLTTVYVVQGEVPPAEGGQPGVQPRHGGDEPGARQNTLPSNLSTTRDKWDALLFLYYIFFDVHLHLPIFEIGTAILSSFFIFKLFSCSG